MKPEIWRFDNANSLYYALIDRVSQEIRGITDLGRDPVVALPTGNTMIPFYRIATEKQALLEVRKWHCFGLDEYYPILPSQQNLSFKNYLDDHFYSKLENQPQSRNFLDGSSENFMLECERYERKIEEAGGIDLAILGIGTNGHIAFNEPGSDFASRTRALPLHPQTLMTNFHGAAPFTHALTMGLGTLLEAKRILVVALGKSKAQAVKSAILEVPSRTLPASALQNHPSVTWFLDQDASSFV